jgi:CubicO group peptidase (beta-lactamase class C family)
VKSLGDPGGEAVERVSDGGWVVDRRRGPTECRDGVDRPFRVRVGEVGGCSSPIGGPRCGDDEVNAAAASITLRAAARQTSLSTHGWGRVDKATPIVADLSRQWTLAEVLEGMIGVPPLREPGTAFGTEAADHGTTALAYTLEQVTGESIADLIEARIISPLGLDDTLIFDGTNPPDGLQHSVFALDGQLLDSSMGPTDAYFT